MPESQNPFALDFDSYILQSEPSKQENGKLWQTAIGLQQVDGLTPSKYLYETAKRNIDGDITIEEAKQLIDSYYELKEGRTDEDDDKEEADKVSVRIREILAEKSHNGRKGKTPCSIRCKHLADSSFWRGKYSYYCSIHNQIS